ncbi:aberrant root formation protein 4 [Cannabis sativa]|uniref:aberrant root formation protein 4 n=1 Tax=Cannabis sativa TaxID=3483 RepID=UPI0029CA51B5|nr:aberrant root formation protein 4 [Cannabis sativa]
MSTKPIHDEHLSSSEEEEEEEELLTPSTSSSRLHEILNSVSNSVEEGDPEQSQNSVADLIDFLNSVSDDALSDPDNENAKNKAFHVLSQLHHYVFSPSFDEATVDALSFELPKAASRFGGVSDKCLVIAGKVIDRFVSLCSPREMLPILCEALDSPSEMNSGSSYFVPLLNGLSQVLISIQKRHFEQLKTAIPIVVKVLMAVSSEFDNDCTELKDLYDGALSIANSVHSVCIKQEGSVNEKIRALLGLYVLQIMALASINMNFMVLSLQPLVAQLSSFLPYCGLSYLGLITGSDVDRMIGIAFEDDVDEYVSCLSYVKHGASFSVIWGHISEVVVTAAKEDLGALHVELQDDHMKRWEAIGMLRHILSYLLVPWELKKCAINILICITDANNSQRCDEEQTDCTSYMPNLYSALQAVQQVIMFASESELRRNAFDAFKRILADVPTSQRFDILKALIKNSDSSSMIAILLDVVRGEMQKKNCLRPNDNDMNRENKAHQLSPFWSASVLELVEFVLRPPRGGPPPLPEHGDAVLSALNFYRFVLLTESEGKTNYTGIVSKNNLEKAYNEWLLPLRTLVSGIEAENNKGDRVQTTVDILCSLNPIEMVLYRCIELVEEKLKQST